MGFISLSLPIMIALAAASISTVNSNDEGVAFNRVFDNILEEIVKCNAQEFVVLTSHQHADRSGVDSAILESISRSGLVFVHYVIDNDTTFNDISEIVAFHSMDQHLRHTAFIITTPRFDDVISSADLCSKKKGDLRGFLWLHTTKWLIVTDLKQRLVSFMACHKRNVPMDNIAFLFLSNNNVNDNNDNNNNDNNDNNNFDNHSNNNNNGNDDNADNNNNNNNNNNSNPSTAKPLVVHSFVWGEHRTKQLKEILVTNSNPSTKKSSITSNQCVVYPNIHYGLNGRHLKVITKVHWGFFVSIGINPKTQQPEYQGFLLDLLHELGSSLNFTYTVLPYPSLEKQPTWDEVAYNVTSGEVDLSATLWSYSWIEVYDISVTYPVILDTFTGVYRRPVPSDEYISLYILCPFHSLTYILLFASLIYTLIIYVLIVEVCYPNEDTTTPRNPFNAERNKEVYMQRPGKHTIIQGPKRNSDTFFDRLRKRTWSLAASVLNQAYLPRPKQMSARLLLFLWSIAMVIFYAIYTGSLTAEMVNSSDANPLNTFKELVDSSRYSWGTTHNSIIDKVMKKATTGILYKLNRRAKNIPDGLNGDIYFTIRDKIKTLERDFVLIHFKIVLNQLVGMMDKPEDYVMMKDTLLSANQGYIVSKQSELGYLFSEQFRKMHESGLIDKMYQKYAHGNRTVFPASSHEGDTNRKTLTLENIRWPLIIIALLVLLSLIVLLVERLWNPIVSLRSSSGKAK